MPATATSQVDATPVAAMADPTASKCCRCQPCHLWEPACRRLQHRRLPRLQSLPWQLPQLASAATASHAICGSRHAGDCNTAGCRDSSRCHGSSHKCCHCQPCHLWEPACRRLQHRRSTRLQSLPWQLPQLASAATASHAICGSRHAGDCNTAGCRDSSRCHGSSHKCCHCQPCHLWEPACRRLQHRRSTRLQSLPWQLPQLASAATASHAICGSRHAGDCNTAGCRDSSRCHGRSHS